MKDYNKKVYCVITSRCFTTHFFNQEEAEDFCKRNNGELYISNAKDSFTCGDCEYYEGCYDGDQYQDCSSVDHPICENFKF